MQFHKDQLNIRIPATVLGISFFCFGLFSIIGGTDQSDPYIQDRALWFGITLLIAGVLAVAISWLVRDLHNIWCVYPRTGRGRFKVVKKFTKDDQ